MKKKKARRGHQACRTTDGREKEEEEKSTKKKERKDEDDGAMKRAGIRRGDEVCSTTKMMKRTIKKVVPSWIFFACGGPNNKGDPGSPSEAFARTKITRGEKSKKPARRRYTYFPHPRDSSRCLRWVSRLTRDPDLSGR